MKRFVALALVLSVILSVFAFAPISSGASTFTDSLYFNADYTTGSVADRKSGVRCINYAAQNGMPVTFVNDSTINKTVASINGSGLTYDIDITKVVTNFTCELYVKPRSSGWAMLAGTFMLDSHTGWSINMGQFVGSETIGVANNISITETNGSSLKNSAALKKAANKWTHVVYVKTASTSYFYIDGVLASSMPSIAKDIPEVSYSSSVNAGFRIGGYRPSVDQLCIPMDIACARIYTSAATAADVAALYTATTGVVLATPTPAPTAVPTATPNLKPTAVPTPKPTAVPTAAPTKAPTPAPTKVPTAAPAVTPTVAPSAAPTEAPEIGPGAVPPSAPSVILPEGNAYITSVKPVATFGAGREIVLEISIRGITTPAYGFDIGIILNSEIVNTAITNTEIQAYNSPNTSLAALNARGGNWIISGRKDAKNTNKINLTIFDENAENPAAEGDVITVYVPLTAKAAGTANDWIGYIGTALGTSSDIKILTGSGSWAGVSNPATPKPTEAPTTKPTEAPTPEPTAVPTAAPTAKPTADPSGKTIRYLSVAHKSNRLWYYLDEELETAGIAVKVWYTDGTDEIIEYSEKSGIEIIYPDINLTGGQYVYLRYAGFETRFSVRYGGRADVRGIRILAKPSKITYLQGERFDATGIVVKALSQDLTPIFSIPVSDLTFTSFRNDEAGIVQVKVFYMHYYGTTFSVRVTDEKLVSSITVTKPTKVSYKTGETFSNTGMKVTAKFYDGTTADIPLSNVRISGFSSSTAGIKTIMVTYKGKTSSFSIKVS